MSTHLFNNLTIAQASPTVSSNTSVASPNAGVQKAPEGPAMMQLFFPVVLILVLYLFLIRPQQKKEKKRQETLKELKKGDKVVTRGGIIGIISEIDTEKQIISIKIADKVNVDVITQAVEVVNPVFEKVQDKDKSK